MASFNVLMFSWTRKASRGSVASVLIGCNTVLRSLPEPRKIHLSVNPFIHSGVTKQDPFCIPTNVRGYLLVSHSRSFASSRPKKGQTKKETEVVSNEKLISVIMKKNGESDPKKVMVRLVIDEGPENPSTVSIVSLAEAIKVSVERMTDLIGTSLEADPPVIRAAELAKLQYRQRQSQQKNVAKAKTQTKSFRFRAGISDHDLERKLAEMIKFLEQGVDCDYSVFSKARLLRENSSAGMDLVNRIQALLVDHAQLKRQPQLNELGTYVRVQLVPKKS